jgi:SSS family solute:Na+ symporter
VGGIVLSVATAYLASAFDNIMDLLQLIFGFVNAPLFATFLLGMFWRRTSGHGAFYGLLLGTLGAAAFHGLSLSSGAVPGIKGGWIGVFFSFRSEMAQNFHMAIVACGTCFVATMLISLLTAPNRTDAELRGLVYSLTPRAAAEREAWYRRPVLLGMIVLTLTVLLNLLFK